MGEASITWAPRPEPPDPNDQKSSAWSLLDDDERAELNSERANSRAAGQLRRYMVHNRLTKMWTLTNRDEIHDRAEMVDRVQAFVRRLRRSLFRDRPFAYAYVIEPHPGGHGLHVHLFLQSIYLEWRTFGRVWGHGYVHYSDFTARGGSDHLGRPLAAGGGRASGRAGARAAARYAAKYGGKVLGSTTDVHAHRYEVAQGFAPPCISVRVRSFEQARHMVANHPSFGWLDMAWSSSSSEEWHGPPVEVVWWSAPTKAVKDRRSRPRVAPT